MLALARAPRERARIGYANGGYRASAKPGSRQRIQRPRRRGASWKPIVHMRSHVRFGSFASILAHPGHVCFSPESDQKSGRAGLVAKCRLCCKSLKTPGDKFPARSRNKPRSLIDVASGSLPKSPVSLSPGDEVPHMFTRKPRLQLEKFAINGAKRLLQHNRHFSDLTRCP